MKIRFATPAQVPEVAKLARQAYEWATGKIDYNESVSMGNWIVQVQTGHGVVIQVVDDGGQVHGLLCGYKSHDIDTGKLSAQMWHWYVDKEAKGWGIRLMWAFEKWSKEQGCLQVDIGCLPNLWDKAHEKIYSRLGYKFTGLSFTKEY